MILQRGVYIQIKLYFCVKNSVMKKIIGLLVFAFIFNSCNDGELKIQTFNFDPAAVNQPGGESHGDNLAELLPDDILEPIGLELFSNYNLFCFVINL